MRFKKTSAPGSSFLRHLNIGGGPLLALILLVGLPSLGGAQENPGYNPTVTPGIQPTVSSYQLDYVPKFSPDFWKGGSAGQGQGQGLQAGAVLTGVLQDKLSSKSSKVGDVFTISLPNGFSQYNNQLLPSGTKIVGAVTQVVSGQKSNNGQPGRIDISLQTLVLPDGRSTPIYAFIERNPNMEHQQNPNKPQQGLPLASYGQSVKSSFAALTNSLTKRAVGMPFYYPGRSGLEFSMDPGEVLPLRLNRPLDLAALQRQPVPDVNTMGMAQGQAYSPPDSGYGAPNATVPGLVEPPVAPSFKGAPAAAPNESPASSNAPASQTPGYIPDPF